jgi:hypothetical protein
MLAHPQITMRKKEREKRLRIVAGMREKEERKI